MLTLLATEAASCAVPDPSYGEVAHVLNVKVEPTAEPADLRLLSESLPDFSSIFLAKVCRLPSAHRRIVRTSILGIGPIQNVAENV